MTLKTNKKEYIFKVAFILVMSNLKAEIMKIEFTVYSWETKHKNKTK